MGLKFRRQHPLPPYVLDFYCHALRLCIEIDGGQHNEAGQREYDERRTGFLTQQGIEVVRYWANEVLRNPEVVLEDLYRRVNGRRGG